MCSQCVRGTPHMPLSAASTRNLHGHCLCIRRCKITPERVNEHRRQLLVVAVGRARRTSDTGRCAHDGGGRLRAAWRMAWAVEPRPATECADDGRRREKRFSFLSRFCPTCRYNTPDERRSDRMTDGSGASVRLRSRSVSVRIACEVKKVRKKVALS